jgi:hypothetical protein
MMSKGHLSSRRCTAGDRHHLWNNNGTWWVHYTLHFGHRKRRIRRSLKTRSLDEAIRRRDELFAQIVRDGEWVADRSDLNRYLVRRFAVARDAAWALLPTASCA